MRLGVPWTVGSVLLAVALGRLAARRFPLPWFAFSLAGLCTAFLGVGLLLLRREPFEADGLLLATAALVGVYWSSIADPAGPANRRAQAIAAGAGVVASAAVVALAFASPWWTPLAVLGVVACVGLVASWAVPAPASSSAAPAAPKPAVAAAPAPGAPPPGRLSIRCPACGFAGSVPAALAGRTVACPRCRSPVAVPGQGADAPGPLPAAASAAPGPARPPRRTS